jgi:hypothetical protein
MKTTRGEYFLRARKLREMSRDEPDGVAFSGVQLVMLGALVRVVAVLASVMGQGR